MTVPVVPPPVPVSATDWGLLDAVSVKLRVADRAPVAVGLKTTVAVQLAEAAKLAPQVLDEMLKSPEFVPVMASLLMVMEALPRFLSVVVCDGLEDPTFTLPKARLVGLTLAPLVDVEPVPVRVAVCGLLLVVSEIESVAVRVPVVPGLNTTVTVQLADAARLAPQVLAETLKSPVFAPVKPMLLIVIEVALPFCNVAVCDALDEPTVTDPNARLVGLKVTLPPPAPVPVPESATV